MAERLFGTDGVRGRAGEGWLSEDRAARLAHAIGAVLGPLGGAQRALIGHDGRRSGPGLARAVAAGLVESGFEAVGLGLTTTPGLALCTRSGEFGVGLMISASHNPAEDNGIKVFDAAGGKLDDALEARIEEAVVDLASPASTTVELREDPNLALAYERHLVTAAEGLDLTGLRLVLDCANGGGSYHAPRVLRELGADVVSIASAPDGDNINRGCGSTHPEALCEAVRGEGAALGVALDGDGDRCLLVDERGTLVDGDAMLTMLALDLARRGALASDRIVATVMSNKGLHKALGDAGIGVTTVGVGDRRVVEALRAESLDLGGEQSGHIVFGASNHYIGDGTLSAIRVLQALRAADRPLSELSSVFRAFPQVLINARVGSKPPFEELTGIAERVTAIEDELGDEGRVLLRYSGTEPLARVMVEGPDQDRIRELAEDLARAIVERIGA